MRGRSMKKIYWYIVVVLMMVLLGTSQSYAADEGDGTNISDSPYSAPKFSLQTTFIIDFLYLWRNVEFTDYNSYEVPLFIYRNQVQTNKTGFNLNYGEFASQAFVDKYFNFFFDMTLTTENVDLQELYVNTTSLPYGFRIKFGRFLSNFGKINEEHAHEWNFFDAPLVQKAFFGDSGLLENGLQVRLRVPTDFGLWLHFEVLQGKNEASFGTDSKVISGTPIGTVKIPEDQRPSLFTGLLESSVNVEDLKIYWGLSIASGNGRMDHNFQSGSGDYIGGKNEAAKVIIAGADLSVKYFFDSIHYIALQGEGMQRKIDGIVYRGKTSPSAMYMGDISITQRGFYLELIAQPIIFLRVGLRGEFLMNDISINWKYSPPDNDKYPTNMYKASAMIDFTPTDYARIRLQYNFDKSLFSGGGYLYNGVIYTGSKSPYEQKLNHEVVLQYTMAIGQHGAFK
jgi:hypothetical protein